MCVRETFRYHFVRTSFNVFSVVNALMFLNDFKTLKTLIPKKAFVFNVFNVFNSKAASLRSGILEPLCF